MKILIFSQTYIPNVGGVEKVAEILAEQFVKSGHQLAVVTETPAKEETAYAFPVYRQITIDKKMQLIRQSDLVLLHGLSLKEVWLKFLSFKPFFVIHHTWYQRNSSGKKSWQDKLKLLLTHSVFNISVSHAIAAHIPEKRKHVVIYNPYEDYIFKELKVRRAYELVFLGRLVSDKGCDLLIEALVLLKNQHIYPKLNIIGEGPEIPELKEMVYENGLQQQVCFLGIKQGKELNVLLNQHQIMVVPSRWPEPFGLVALEGLAAGCRLIVPDQGGLQEAVGQEGLIFANNQAASLAEAIFSALLEKEPKNNHVYQHLKSFEAIKVAERYVDLFEAKMKIK